MKAEFAGWQECSYEELIEYVSNYPRELEFSTCFIVEPPIATYNEIIDGEACPIAEFYDDYLDNNKRVCRIRKRIDRKEVGLKGGRE